MYNTVFSDRREDKGAVKLICSIRYVTGGTLGLEAPNLQVSFQKLLCCWGRASLTWCAGNPNESFSLSAGSTAAVCMPIPVNFPKVLGDCFAF